MPKATENPVINPGPAIKYADAPQPNVESEVENNGAKNDENNAPKEVLVAPNPLRPEIKVDAKRVKEVSFHVTAWNYYPTKDEDKPGTFAFSTQEAVPGTYTDPNTLQIEINNNLHRFPISEWGVWPVLRSDPLLSSISNLLKKVAKNSSDEFNEEFAHAFDNMKVDACFIYVPAGVPFINPWSSEPVPTGKIYERPYVFGFIRGFKFDPLDARHRKIIKGIFTGMPKYNEEKDKRIPRIEPIDDSPRAFVELTLKRGGYLTDTSDSVIELLIDSLSYSNK